MALGSNNRVQIARRPSVRPGISFAGKTNALPIASPSLDANFERLGLGYCAFAVAGWTRCQILTCSVTARTLDIELHPPTRLGDLSGAVAFGTLAGSLERSLAVTGRADVVARDIQPHHAAADCRPERNIDLIFQVRPRFTAFLCMGGALPSAQDRAKNVAEAAAAPTTAASSAAGCAVAEIGEIKSAEVQ